MTISLVKDLTLAHADLLSRGVDVTSKRLLVEIGVCPKCGGDVIRGDKVAVCTDCGTRTDIQ